jgi:pyruvate dehydrogenase E2 component (dihydrolipoamide acetyltransferase)
MSMKPLIEEMLAAAHAGPSPACLEHYAGTTRQVEGLRSEAVFGQHRFTVDEPQPYGGGTAANPAEVLLAAVGASIEVTARIYAELLGIPLRGISTRLAGTLDLRGFFATDANVRAGFDRIDIAVVIDSPADAADIARLLEKVERGCPMLDVVRGATPVRLATEMKPPVPA